jgi:dTDP-4-amino-4,6-dideoxygalactose transaminase
MEDWIYVTRSSMPPLKNNVRYLYHLWETRHLTNQGEKHGELERTLASELGVSHVTLTANGHLALELALKSLGCTGEVITTPFTFASTTQAIVNTGCTPVFCDIDLFTLTIDPSKIEALITPKTSAILAVHVFGRVCDVEQIEAIAKKHNLHVIYDAAHAYKVKVNDEPISQFGDCTMYSLHATKLFHAVEGGALATNEPELAKRFEAHRNFEIVAEETSVRGGSNTKMSEFHAAMGLCNIDYVDGWIAQRKELYERYVDQLKGVEGVSIPSLQPHVTPNYSYFPILLDMDRDGLIAYLKEHRIVARKYFYPLTSSIVSIGGVGTDNGLMEKSSTPVASWASDRVLCLPLYADLTFTQIDKVCACIKEYIQRTTSAEDIGNAPSEIVKKRVTVG